MQIIHKTLVLLGPFCRLASVPLVGWFVLGFTTGTRGAYRALCAQRTTSWLFSTTGSSVSSED